VVVDDSYNNDRSQIIQEVKEAIFLDAVKASPETGCFIRKRKLWLVALAVIAAPSAGVAVIPNDRDPSQTKRSCIL